MQKRVWMTGVMLLVLIFAPRMSRRRLWGGLFFVFLFFAAVPTVIAVFENILAFCMERWGWSRRKSSLPCR